MEEREKTGVDQPATNGADAADEGGEVRGDEASASRNRQLDELTHAYERARDELNDAVRALRAEIARVDFDQARVRARNWVDENPTLAVFLGVGAGIITGRLLSNAFRSEPPPMSVRARRRADRLADDAGAYAGELGTALAYHLGRAARAAGRVQTSPSASRRRLGRPARTFRSGPSASGKTFLSVPAMPGVTSRVEPRTRLMRWRHRPRVPFKCWRKLRRIFRRP